MSKYYYHGMGEAYYCTYSIEKLLGILTTGGIKCKRLLGFPDTYKGSCSGMDYVSVCKKFSDYDYKRDVKYEHAFPMYVQNCFCLIISDQIETIKPLLIPLCSSSERHLARVNAICSNVRYTDMFDEWQVYEQIPLSSVIGIGLPVQWIDYHVSDYKQLEQIGKIIAIAENLVLILMILIL